MIRPAQFVFICSLPFLCLGQNLTFGAHYFPICETWHMIGKLTRAILWICCHLSKTGDRLKFIQGESWFSAPSHILEWRRCCFSPLQLFPELIITFSSHRLVLNHEQMWKIHHHVFDYEHVWDWIVESRSQTSRRRPPLQPKLSETVWHSSRGFFLS